MFSKDLLVNLKVTKFKRSKEVVKTVRLYSEKSIGEISAALKSGGVIFEIRLIKTEFYNGWKTLYELTEELQSINVSFAINVNGEGVDLQFLQDLKERVTNIKREDIY